MEKRNIIAFTKKVIVTPIDRADTSSKGIIVGASDLPADEGMVVAIGPDVESQIKVGDTVTFNEYGGKKYTIDDQSYICLHENELYCKLEN